MTFLKRLGIGITMLFSALWAFVGMAPRAQTTVSPSVMPTSTGQDATQQSNVAQELASSTGSAAARPNWILANGGFNYDDGVVTTLPSPIPGLLMSAFDGSITKSTSTVFASGVPIPNADVSSFVVYPGGVPFAKDEYHVYCLGGRDSTTTIIVGADATTFAPVQETGYATDTAHVYAGCTVLPYADPATFVALGGYANGGGYVKDKSHVWYLCAEDGSESNCPSSVPQLVPGADPATFELYSSDAPITATTTLVDATDKNHAYNSGKVVK